MEEAVASSDSDDKIMNFSCDMQPYTRPCAKKNQLSVYFLINYMIF